MQEIVTNVPQLHTENLNDIDKVKYSTVVKINTKRLTVIKKKNDDLSTGNNKLEGVPKTVSLHVYRLPPSTESEDVLNFLKPKFP